MLAMKKMRDSAMSAQTKDMVRTTKVLLLSMQDYQGQPIIVDNLPLSTCMLDLTERPGLSNISNQVSQITQNYNCSPHMPLWLKLIKINGFIAPPGVWYGGFSSWLFRQDYHTISEDQNNNRLRLAAGLEGEGKTSIEDFNKVLGSMTYAEPKVIKDASKILEAVLKTVVKLAGDHPCITSIGYLLAATLMGTMDREIVENIDHTDQLLVRLLHMIDREVQLAFCAIYKQVVWAKSSAFRIDKSIISTLCDQTDIIFKKIMRNQVSDFHLPVELENNSTRKIL